MRKVTQKFQIKFDRFFLKILASSDPDKYLNKLKRQERVIEEVKLVIKPYYANRKITKEQYKEIMRKAVPKVNFIHFDDLNAN